MDTLCQILAFALLATLAQAFPYPLREEHIAGTYGTTSPHYHQHPPQLYPRHSSSTNATFTYPHSHLPANRNTAAWKSYQGFLGLVIIMFCVPTIGALAWFVHRQLDVMKDKNGSDKAMDLEEQHVTDPEAGVRAPEPAADTGWERA